MKDITLRATCRCRACDGTGRVSEPIWQAFNEADMAWQEKHPYPLGADQEKIDAWNQAWKDFEWCWWDSRYYDIKKLPPEEHPCHACKGTGTEVFNLTLQELIELLEEYTHA